MEFDNNANILEKDTSIVSSTHSSYDTFLSNTLAVNAIPGASNIRENILNLVNKYSSNKDKLKSEMDSLKSEINEIDKKLNNLEISGLKLLRQKNREIVAKYGGKLVNCMKNRSKNFENFKKIIRDSDFPLDEFIPLDTDSFNGKAENTKSDQTDLNVNKKKYYTLLQLCTKYNLTNFAEFLIKNGAQVDIPDKEDGWIPLMFSVQHKNSYLTRLLLDNGANINRKDVDGFSVIAIAIDSLNFELCQLLLKYNPIIDVSNFKNFIN